MTDKFESQGKTVEEAVNEALLRMGARKDEVNIEVLAEPRSGLFGILGGKAARVLVTRKKGRGGRGRQDYRQTSEDAVAHDLSEKDASKRDGQGRGERQEGRSGGRGSRGGRSRRGGRGRRDERQDENRSASTQDNRPEGARNNRSAAPSGQQAGQEERGPQRRRGGRRNERRSDAPRQDDGRNNKESRPRVRSRREDQEAQPAARTDQGDLRQREADAPRSERQERRPASRRNDQSERPGRDDRSERRGGAARRSRSRRSAPASVNGDRPERAESPERREVGETADIQSPNLKETPAAAAVENKMTPDEIILTGIQATKYADPLRNVPEEEVEKVMSDLTNGMLIRAGFPIRCEVKPGEYRQVKIVTDDSSAGMLIGRHGSTVDSIEHLVERMVSTAAGDRVRMNLDINNYRRRREEALHERAREAAAMVLENGRTYHMEPMSPRERRIVHLHIETMEGVRTFTMGGGSGKHVVLAPDNGEENGKDRASAGGDEEWNDKSQDTGTDAESMNLAEDGLPLLDDDFDDGPQPESNDLVVDDDEPRPLL